jgi:putative endonuclease
VTERTRLLGEAGERIASKYLEDKGFHILERNVRRPEGEIDLIALEGEALVFVEVKLRTSRRMGAAVQQIAPAKAARLMSLAEGYHADHPELPADLRIDVVAIELTVGGDVGQLNHVRNAIER